MFLKIKQFLLSKNFIKLSLISAAGLAFAVFVYALSVILFLPKERIKLISEQEHENNFLSVDTAFESGSVVNKDEFKYFKMFLSGAASEDLKDVRKDISSELFTLNKDLIYKKIIRNNCEDPRCFQHKIPFSKIPSGLWKGLIGIEDYRFIEHKGVDPISIARAIITDIKHMKMVQGGSTLTQQLIKNLYYSSKKTISRKINEMITALYIEYNYSKENILEAYFNEVYWGSLYGVQIKGVFSASLYYFGKKPSELSSYESAILISLLKGPGYYHPIRRTQRLRSRADLVMNKLIERSLLSRSEKLWSDKDWASWIKSLESEQRYAALKSIGLLYSSFMQRQTHLSFYEKYVFSKKALELLKEKQMSFKEDNLSVKALLINFDEPDKTFYFYNRFERNLNDAIEKEKHLVGSTLKPIAYGVFSELGLSLDREVPTGPIELNLKSGPWSPRESHKIKEPYVSLKKALSHSYNRPVIYLAKELGFQKVETSLKEYFPSLLTPLAQYPAQLLGSIELSLKDLLAGYRLFINKHCKSEQTEVFNTLIDPNHTTIRKAVDRYLSSFEFFGKTGTSNNGLDNWFVFYDGQSLGVIWFGYEGDRKGKSFRLYGSTTSFKIFQNFFRDRGKRFHDLRCADFSNVEQSL